MEAHAEDPRPIPTPTVRSRPFWDGCREQRLLVLRCDDCGHRAGLPPDPMCPRCGSRSQQWVESSGRGEIDSFTVVHRPQQVGFEVPYVVGIVRLEEQDEEEWYLLTAITGIDPDDVRIGMPVRPRFAPRAAGIVVPEFAPTG